jgi:pheromone shutdown protein TraB
VCKKVKSQIYNIDYNDYIHFVGTAHFTRRSLQDAYEAVRQLQPSDLAIELDMRRFRILNITCSTCSRKATCTHKCEFIAATEAIGNVDKNIWLIDMSEHEIGQRIRRLMQLMAPRWTRLSRVRIPFISREDDITRLWEQGFKDEVLNSYQRRLERLRRGAPHIWRVLIDERNALMAVRLAWIASEKLKEDEEPKILALVGAAHVDGIKALLKEPITIKENLRRLNLTFTPPTLIRRISVNANPSKGSS